MEIEDLKNKIVQRVPVFLRTALHAVSRRVREHAKRN